MHIEMPLKSSFCATVAALAISLPSLAWLPPPDTATFMVFFSTDSTSVTEQGMRTMREHLIREANGRYDGPITVTGHCDTEEKDVSLARAEAVVAKLIELGIPASRMSVQSRGDLALLVLTPPGVREPQNRRVEIFIERLCGKSCPEEKFQDSGSSRD
jgi:OmpA-OmpF porin, OOP family